MSLDISRFDHSNPSNLITHGKFENYIDLQFKINESVKIQKKNYTIRISTQTKNNLMLDKLIMVYRIDMTNIGELFVTISDSTHDLRASFLVFIYEMVKCIET